MTRRFVKPLARVLGLLPFVALAPAARADKEQAQSADRFVDSIGVCTHWTYGDTPYGFAYEAVKKRLLESGIRHIRDGLSDRAIELGKLGIRTCAVTDPDQGSPAEIKDKIKALNQQVFAIDAVEGPNEPDLFWVGNKKSYRGQGFAQGTDGIVKGVTLFQQDLYAAIKGDPATKNLPVFGPALGKAYDPGGGSPNPFPKGSLTPFVDYGNFHPYPGGNPFSLPFSYAGIAKYYWNGNFPSGNLDEFPYAFDVGGPPFAPKPMVATETGYSTDKGGPTEAVHAKYMPRLFCEYFRKGVYRAYSYEFVDEFEDRDNGNREAHFGLLRRDQTPKPAYGAMKNLIAVLSDRGAAARLRPTALDYTLVVQPSGGYDRTQYVHHLLLQKASGDFYLVLWHEIADEDTSVTPHRPITPPAMPAVLTFATPIKAVTRYVPNALEDGTTGKSLTLTGNKLAIEVPDQVIILKLTPQP